MSQHRPRLYNRLVTRQQQQEQQRRDARTTRRTDHVQWERGAASWRDAQQIARSQQQTDSANATTRGHEAAAESVSVSTATTHADVSEQNVPTLSGMRPLPVHSNPPRPLSNTKNSSSSTSASAVSVPTSDTCVPVQKRPSTNRSCAELAHPTSQTWFKQQQQQWQNSRRRPCSGPSDSKPPLRNSVHNFDTQRQHNEQESAGNGSVTHGAGKCAIRPTENDAEEEEGEIGVVEDDGDDDDKAEQEAVRQWNTRTKSQESTRAAPSVEVQARAQARSRPHSAALRRPPRRSVRPASAAPATRVHTAGQDPRSHSGARTLCGHEAAADSSAACSKGNSRRKKPSSAGARWLNAAAMPAPSGPISPSGYGGVDGRTSNSNEKGNVGALDCTGDMPVTMDLVWSNRGRGDGLSQKDRRRADEAARASARVDTITWPTLSGEQGQLAKGQLPRQGDAEQVRPSVRIGGREVAPYGTHATQATMQQRLVRRAAGTSTRAFSARTRRPASGALTEVQARKNYAYQSGGGGKRKMLRPKSAPTQPRASRQPRPASGQLATAHASSRRLVRPSAAAQGRRSRWQRQQARAQARQKARTVLDDAIAELEDGSSQSQRSRGVGQRSGHDPCYAKDNNAWQQRAETLLFNPDAPMPPKPGGSARNVVPVPAAVMAATADMLHTQGTADVDAGVVTEREPQVQAEQHTHGELQVAHKWLPHVSSFLSQTNAVIHKVVAVTEQEGEQRGCRIEVDLARPRYDTFMQHMPEEATVGGGIVFFATPAPQEPQQPSIVRALRRMVDETAVEHNLQAAEALRLQHTAAEQKAAAAEAATFAVQMRGQPAQGSWAPKQAQNNDHEPHHSENASMARELHELRQRVASLEQRNVKDARDDRTHNAAQSGVPQERLGELHSLERGWSEQVPWKSGKDVSGGEPVSLSRTVLQPGGELEQRLNWIAGDDDSETSGSKSRRSSCSSNAALAVRETNTTGHIVDGSLGPAGYWGSGTQTKNLQDTEREELRQQRKRKDQRLIQALTERVADDIVARELAPSDGSDNSADREETVHFGPTTLTEEQEFRSLLSAAAKGDLDRVRLLVDVNQHVDVNWHGDLGADLARTALHLAARGGQIDVVWFLLNRGADATSCDAKGFTPLESAKQAVDAAHRAAENGDASMARTAARVQACVDALDTTSIFQAARTGDVRRVRYLLTCEALDPRVSNKNGMTALHMAVANQQQDVVDLLLGVKAGSGSDPALRKNPVVSPAMVLELCALRNNRGHLPVDLAKVELDEAMKRGGGATREMQEALTQKGVAGGEDGEGSVHGRSVAAKAAVRATMSRQQAAELMVSRFHDIAKRAEERAVQRGHNAIQSEQAAKRALRKAALAKEVARGTAASAAVIEQHAKAVHRAAAATEKRRRVAGENVEPRGLQARRRTGSASRQRALSSLEWDDARSYVVGAAKSRGRLHARFEAVTMRADNSKESSKGPVQRTRAARRRARADMKNGKLAVSDARFQTWFRAQYPMVS